MSFTLHSPFAMIEKMYFLTYLTVPFVGNTRNLDLFPTHV